MKHVKIAISMVIQNPTATSKVVVKKAKVRDREAKPKRLSLLWLQ